MLAISFYIQRQRLNLKKEVPIVIRIKLHNQRRDISSGLRVKPDQWNSTFNTVVGNSIGAKQINKLLEVSKNRLFEIYTQMSYGGDIFIDDIVNTFQGKDAMQEKYILKLVREHNHYLETRIGKDYTKSTYQKYLAMEIRLKQFVQEYLHRQDVPVRKLELKFISSFFMYLKDVHNNEHNSATKTTKNLKRVLQYGVEQGYIKQNPFNGFKCGYKETNRTILTMEELQRIELKTFTLPRLELIRNLFLFQCYTGLSFVDMAELTWKNIVKRSDDAYWLEIARRKTGQVTQIPLFPIALDIIAKYNHPGNHKSTDPLLPGCKIQKANSYLKEIADLCGILKNLSTHAGRRTFASTVLLNNGVRIEAVSRMLAHTSLKTTQLYAKVFDQHLVDQTRHISWLWNKKQVLPHTTEENLQQNQHQKNTQSK